MQTLRSDVKSIIYKYAVDDNFRAVMRQVLNSYGKWLDLKPAWNKACKRVQDETVCCLWSVSGRHTTWKCRWSTMGVASKPSEGDAMPHWLLALLRSPIVYAN